MNYDLIELTPERPLTLNIAETIVEYPVSAEPSQTGRTFRISSSFYEAHISELLSTLKNNIDVFAWSSSEMPGIDVNVACHRFNIEQGAKAVKQKMRPVTVKLADPIREVDKLQKAGFIREVQYPEWLANVVMIPKASGSWRMCVDFTNLNNACPKDSYPLPRIDALVDSAVGYPVLSFLDAFSGYHQIKMHPADEEKTAFITREGVFVIL